MSDLLNSASLVMIPSGYAEDKVYSAVPTDGSGDLSFTRASDGTRINSAGLVEVTPWNLVQQSETFDNAFWSVDNGSITANSTTAPNGTATADTLTRNSSTAYLYNGSFNLGIGEFTQSIYAKANASSSIRLEFVTGAFARGAACIFDLSNGTAGSITIYGGVSGFTASIENVGNGWYRCSIGGTITIADTYYYEISITTGSIYIWGAQLNIGSTAKPYFPTTDRLNVPRLTYQNGGGGCPSLLLEKQSTNLTLDSQDFTTAGWIKLGTGLTVSGDTTISPDGTQNADTLNVSNNDNVLYRAYSGTFTGNTFTFSIYAKGTGTFDMNIRLNSTTTTTQTKTLSSAWQRFDVTVTNAVPVVSIEIYLSLNTSSTYNIWGAQVEASSYPTSYIPTTSASATRVADACYKTGISSLIGQTEGTIFVDVENNETEGACIISTNAGTGSASHIYIGQNNNNLALYIRDSFTYSVLESNIANIIGRKKIALAYGASFARIYMNGTQIYNNTSAVIPSGLDRIEMNNFVSTDIGSVKFNEVVYFKTKLTNAELASLTTI